MDYSQRGKDDQKAGQWKMENGTNIKEYQNQSDADPRDLAVLPVSAAGVPFYPFYPTTLSRFFPELVHMGSFLKPC